VAFVGAEKFSEFYITLHYMYLSIYPKLVVATLKIPIHPRQTMLKRTVSKGIIECQGVCRRQEMEEEPYYLLKPTALW